ncbi:MAG: hypothetical protein ACJ790_23080 [Myxococcaceae bacterium]
MRFLLGSLLVASLAHAATVKVAVLQVKPLEPALAGTADVMTEALVTELGHDKRLEIISASDVSALVGLERQKQLLGCSESSASCLAELSGALGARFVVVGSLGRVGRQRRLDLRVLDSENGKALDREGALVAEDNLGDELKQMAQKLAAAIPVAAPEVVQKTPDVPKQEVKPTEPEPPPHRDEPVVLEKSGPSKGPAIGVTALGGAMLLGGGAFALITANGWNTRAKNLGDVFFEDAQKERSAAQTQAIAGYAIAGAGAVVTGIGVWMLTRDSGGDAVHAAIIPTASGVAATLGGSF